jgi:hypothetical protein
LLESLDYPKRKLSVTVLTSSMSEFVAVQKLFSRQIEAYPRLSLLFRDDFSPQDAVTRHNRHDQDVQVSRRRAIARYRNYALLSTMEPWHEHVLWLDADVHRVPSTLLSKMTRCTHAVVLAGGDGDDPNRGVLFLPLGSWPRHRGAHVRAHEGERRGLVRVRP